MKNSMLLSAAGLIAGFVAVQGVADIPNGPYGNPRPRPMPGPVPVIVPNTNAVPPVVQPPFLRVRNAEKPMVVASYNVNAKVNGLFAMVRTLIVFSNPNSRVLEGELEFPLPDGASVCGYALDVDGCMRDGVVVKKDEARVAFEAEVKAGVDPGLVEHVKGNLWKTRIYPIPANGSRSIRVEYVTPLVFGGDNGAALSLPMPREKLAERCVSITVPLPDSVPAPVLGGLGDRRFARAEAVWRVSSLERDVTPARDVLVALPQLPADFAAVEKSESECWFAVSTLPPARPAPKPITSAPAFRILWDASGSRRKADVELALKAVNLLPRETYYSLVVFRDVPEPERYYSSRAELVGALTNVVYDGGTDFAALAATNRLLTTAKDVMTLLFTDGMDTLSAGAGDVTFKGALALVSGGEKDVESLRLACGGRVLDLAVATDDQIAGEILHPGCFLAGVSGEGVDLVQGVGQSAIGRVVVLGRLVAETAEVRLDFGADGMSQPFTLSRSQACVGDVLARARAARRITQLSPRADDNVEELEALGREYGLASPKTSLIVLDTLAQYLKYNIEPPATAGQLHRDWLAKRPDPDEVKRREESAEKSYLSALSHEWKERVQWHKNPVPKRATPKSGLFDEDGDAGAAAGGRDRSRPGVMRRMANAAGEMLGGERRSMARAASVPMSEDAMVCAEVPAASPAMAPRLSKSAKSGGGRAVTGNGASVKLSAWNPNTPYLRSLDDCAKAHSGTNAPADMLYHRYISLRAANAEAPAFFLDCAGFFFKRGDRVIALRVLSNLAEMKIEDPALLRTYAWRLREAGDLDRAIPVLRKVAKLRPEEPHSFRDLALLLGERARDCVNSADAAEAMALLKKTAFTPWKRQNGLTVSVFAVEEFNALAAWCDRQEWPDGAKPAVPEWKDDFKYLPDVDLRIILSWDADNTDIDIHVLEPSGEEAYYSHRRTASGGFVSKDITTGYGPEEYLQVKGQKGVYKVLTHYYGSSQQRLTGPATATATVYTDWGRPAEKRQILSLRLDKPREKVTVGEITFKGE